jgi:hypothetical protein
MIFAIGALAMIVIAAARGYFPDDRSFNYLLTTAAVVCVAPFMRAMSPQELHNLVRALGYLTASWIVLLLVTQAVDSSVFREIKYETDTPASYYQMYSKVFGVAAVLAFSKGREKSRIFAYCVGWLCILLSLYMGGRGESFFAALTCAVMLRRWAIVGFLTLGMGVVIAFPSWIDYLAELPAIQRAIYSLRLEDYGTRDVLIANALDILHNEFTIFAVGGGANFFQKVYDASFEWYPHNIVLEAMLTFGVIAGAYYAYVFLQHVAWFLMYIIRDVRNRDLLTLSAVIAYLVFVALKGESVWMGWLLYFLVLVHPQTRLLLRVKSRRLLGGSKAATVRLGREATG